MKSGRATLLCITLLSLLGAAPAPAPVVKIPHKDPLLIPEPTDIASAERRVREIYASDFAKRSASEKIDLANRLIAVALETNDNPAARYVLISQSINLAASAADVALAMQAIDRLQSDFKIDSASTADQLISQLRPVTADQAIAATKACLLAIDWAIESDNDELADKFIQQAKKFAEKSLDRDLLQQVVAKEIRIKTILALIADVAKAKTTLQTDPDDKSALELLGESLCLIKNQFPQGLPLLAKSKSPLAPLAKQDLAQPSKSADQFELGNSWWTLSDSATDLLRKNLQQHAAGWYVKSAPTLEGLNRETAVKRINDAQNTFAISLSLSPGVNAQIFQTENFEKPLKTRVNSNIDYDNAVKSDPDLPKDHYSIRFTGQILLPAPGKYEFTLIANDGAKVFVENQKAIDDPKLSTQRNGVKFVVDSELRKLSLRVEYFNATGVGRCRLLWKSPFSGKDEPFGFLFH